MQDEHTNTKEQLHQAFHNYLMEKFDGVESEVNTYLETAERIIPNTLNDYFGTAFTSIYEIQNTGEIENIQKKIKADPILKGIDMSEEPRYTEVLKWYRLFVKGLNADTIPVPVPGEYVPIDDKHPSKFAETPARQPIIQNTIYLEGDAAESQPKEIRHRNMLLRQACIDYYRTLHDGRIVCECCGFDFGKAYVIDDDYIEVHHKFPFSHTDGEHPVNSQTDLVPLCANCHRMIHHGQGGKGNCITVEQLKDIYKGIRYYLWED